MARVSTEQLAKACSLTSRRIRQLVQEGMPRAGHGRYDLGVCMSWYIRYLQAVVERRATPEDSGARLAMAEADLEKAIADAGLAKLKLARERGTMHHDDDAVAEVRRFCGRVRAGILAFPSRYAGEVLGLQTLPDAARALTRVATGLLTDLQRDAGGTGDAADLGETRPVRTSAKSRAPLALAGGRP